MPGSIGDDAFVVRSIRKNEGGNLYLLFHTDPFVPVRIPFQYVTLHAEDHYAESSRGQHVRTLKALYHYCQVVAEFDLDALLMSGRLPNVDVLTGFARWMRNGRKDPANLVGRIGLVSEHEVILRNTVTDYMNHVKQYLYWAAYTFASRGGSEAQIGEQFKELKDWLNRYFSRFTGPPRPLTTKGLDRTQMHRLRSVARPGSPNNPFRSEAVQFRNWCILEILYATGMRRGELLSALSSDMPSIHNDHKWLIRRRPADPKDRRDPRPAVKTKERDIQLLPRYSDLLKKYVDKYRFTYTVDPSGIRKKRKPPHDFLLINTINGAPLSIDSINKMLSDLEEAAFPNEEVDLHPHILRNTYCNEFMEHAVNIDKRTLSEAMEELRRLCGWTLKSDMPRLYAEKWMQGAADDAQRSRLLSQEEQDAASGRRTIR